ncbi:MAG TPA: LysR substrate-binding domain-containing protein [Rubrivivax sp.]|nr:LysR substrate-binding domain-containing protein [Rubrivivax sp.]
MELRQLRYFVGVHEAGSLLKASTRLHVAQPALGQQMAALEAELGARLLHRSSRGVTLTEAGKVFLEHARVVLSDVERARLAVRESTSVPAGEVAIGLTTTVGLVATVPILRACRERLPQVRLKMVEAYSGFLREWLVSGRLDLALLFDDQADAALARRPLLEDRLSFISGAQAHAPRRLALQALARWPLILPGKPHGLRRQIDDAIAPLGIVAEMESLGSVKRAVEQGIGCTILPLGAVAEEVAAKRLVASRIDNPAMTRRVVCATSVTRPTTPACAAVIELVAEVLRGMVAGGSWPARWLAAPAG